MKIRMIFGLCALFCSFGAGINTIHAQRSAMLEQTRLSFQYEEISKATFGMELRLHAGNFTVNHWALVIDGRCILLVKQTPSYTTAFIRGPELISALHESGLLNKKLIVHRDEFTALVRFDRRFNLHRLSETENLLKVFTLFEEIYANRILSVNAQPDKLQQSSARTEILQALLRSYPEEYWWQSDLDAARRWRFTG